MRLPSRPSTMPIDGSATTDLLRLPRMQRAGRQKVENPTAGTAMAYAHCRTNDRSVKSTAPDHERRLGSVVTHARPARQAFCNDPGRLHGGLTQGSVLDDLALHARAFVLQHLPQRLQLGDQLVELLHRGAGHALAQVADIARYHFAVVLGLPPLGCNVAADEFADFPFHLRLDCLAGLNRFVRFLARFHECHVDFPVCTPVWRFPSLQLPHDNVTASRPCRGFRKYLGAVRVWNLLPCRIANLRRSCRRYSNTATTLLRLDSGHRLAEILRYCLR